MEASVALQILLWVAVVVVYLGLAAVLREVRLLRAQVRRLQSLQAVTATGATPQGGPDIRLPAQVTGGSAGVVVAADTTCPSCAAVVHALADHVAAGRLETPVSILTWEPQEAWAQLAGPLRVVRDTSGWEQIAHLSPPVLLRVDADGRVGDLTLPVTGADIDPTLTSWGALATPTHESRGTS